MLYRDRLPRTLRLIPLVVIGLSLALGRAALSYAGPCEDAAYAAYEDAMDACTAALEDAADTYAAELAAYDDALAAAQAVCDAGVAACTTELEDAEDEIAEDLAWALAEDAVFHLLCTAACGGAPPCEAGCDTAHAIATAAHLAEAAISLYNAYAAYDACVALFYAQLEADHEAAYNGILVPAIPVWEAALEEYDNCSNDAGAGLILALIDCEN
jgi:hypothetical protein